MEQVVDYFQGDLMASDAWKDKYQMKDQNKNPVEQSPDDMHMRMAIEFAEIEYQYSTIEHQRVFYYENDTRRDNLDKLSDFGRKLITKRVNQTKQKIVDELFFYFRNFSRIVPQGSIMANLGNPYVFGSLSNCFGVASPSDSYAGIMRADQEIAQLMKRRGGVGLGLDNLRPVGAFVSNASRSSTGVPSFAERFSNTTREVAQEGRRGALIELLMVAHPDIFKFVGVKKDETKVTGANISVKFTNKFLKAVEKDEDFYCSFPVDAQFIVPTSIHSNLEYNKLIPFAEEGSSVMYIMKIRAKELFTEFVETAHSTAEPGAAYIDTIVNYSPDGIYYQYKPSVCNPCGEQWFHEYDTCRLIAQNLFNIILNAFTKDAKVDFDALYETSYMLQRLGDDLVDLEAKHIDRIITKILDEIYAKNDPDFTLEAQVELNLWKKVKKLAIAGRRTGSGITALGDMIAAMGFNYGSVEGRRLVTDVLHTKMRAELDATIDMAILRGTFEGWDRYAEFHFITGKDANIDIVSDRWQIGGNNDFYKMLIKEFPEQARKMAVYGRRNVSWSTVAPTGTVSLMTQTTSGLEPLFKAYYIRRKKINANQSGIRVDFVDATGDSWQEYAILHPKFKEWINAQFNYMLHENPIKIGENRYYSVDEFSKEMIQDMFEKSPWYGSQADDISWQDRLEMNSIVQKYTTNAISCTINLPSDVSVETVYNIYFYAWKKGLKGVTVYRDGSRSGVLISEKTITAKDEFGYNNAVKRPTELDADYHFVIANGKKYAVIVGLLDNNPYEVFAFENPIVENAIKGKIIKRGSRAYDFHSAESHNYVIENLQVSHPDEKLLTRWASLSLRHGTHPKYVVDQIAKSETYITSFPQAIARVLKSYIPNEEIKGEECPNCHSHTMIREEGCKKCTDCGYSKC